MEDKPLVERVNPGDLATVARVLAMAYAEDPVHLWAMPKAATRLADATTFFTFILRRMRPQRWEVFSTTDRTAVAVMAPVNQVDRDGVRSLPPLLRTISPVIEYFRWIETFRPNVDHQYLEFIGCLPSQRSQGRGSLLLGSLLARADREGLSTWSWSSNPRNLTFYRRLGFETGPELRRGDGSPAVTMLWRPPAPLTPTST